MLVAAAFSPGKYSSALDCMHQIVESEGYSSLFAGWTYPILMGVGGALSLLRYRSATALLATNKPRAGAVAHNDSANHGHVHEGVSV